MAEIRLASDWPRPLVLAWTQGVVGKTIGSKTKRTLKPGDKTLLDIARAQAYFGMFTLPHDIEDVMDEKRRAGMLQQFDDMKARTLLQWGDFPKSSNHMKDGNEPLGPCRFPDVFVTVIEADGERWPEMRLRDLYGWGDYWDAEQKPKQFARPNDQSVLEDKLRKMELENAETKGMLQAILAQQQAAIAAAAGAKNGGK
jgi:hypothetical protein